MLGEVSTGWANILNMIKDTKTSVAHDTVMPGETIDGQLDGQLDDK